MKRHLAWARHAFRRTGLAGHTARDWQDAVDQIAHLSDDITLHLHRAQAELDIARGFIALRGLDDEYQLHAAATRHTDRSRRQERT